MPSCSLQTIQSNRQLSGGMFRLAVTPSEAAKPGQFYMLRPEHGGPLLPRPISVCDQTGTELAFLIQTVGPGTAALSRLREGEKLQLTGPLGNGFPLNSLTGKVALVSGGVGIAPMLFTARALWERGVEVECLCGFADEPCLVQELAAFASVHISTQSGCIGTKGLVTSLLEPSRYSTVLCCGPEPMMKAVTQLCVAAGTPVYVSLENRMACGIGACLTCTCTGKNGKSLRVCKEGPVFRGEDIDFDA